MHPLSTLSSTLPHPQSFPFLLPFLLTELCFPTASHVNPILPPPSLPPYPFSPPLRDSFGVEGKRTADANTFAALLPCPLEETEAVLWTSRDLLACLGGPLKDLCVDRLLTEELCLCSCSPCFRLPLSVFPLASLAVPCVVTFFFFSCILFCFSPEFMCLICFFFVVKPRSGA